MLFKRTRYVATFGVLAFLSIELEARPSRPFYQAGRALAMGGAYTAVGTDFEAVYYNSAGIARRNRPRLKLIDIETTVSQSFVSIFDGSYTKFMNLQQILQDVENRPGKPYGIGMSFLPQFLIRNFSLGVLFRGQTEATYDADTETTNMYSYADLGAYIHYGVAFGGGIFKLGVGAKVLNRAELDKEYAAADFASGSLSFADQWKEGLAVGADVGALLTLPVVSLPTFGVSVQDVGRTTFQDRRVFFSSDSAPEGAPESLEQTINVGYSMIFKHARGMRTVFALDYKDVTGIDGAYFDHVHAGLEFNSNNVFFLRAGLNQGRYWTAGIGFELGSLGIEFASYGENLADKGETRRPDRKYVGRYVLSF